MENERSIGVGNEGVKNQDSREESELSRQLWDEISSASKGTKAPENSNPEIANQWRSNSKVSDKTDRISIKASVILDPLEFRRLNPTATNFEQLIHSKDKAEFKVRHATTGEIDSGWKLDSIDNKGNLVLSKNYSMEVQAKNKHDGLVEAIPNVPERHIKALEEKLAQLPENVKEALKKAGYKIIATRFNTDAIPELKDLSPRGWDKNSNFDTSDGTHDNLRRVILAPYLYKPWQASEAVDRPEVLVHQIGHALDHAYGKLSNDPDFQKAFITDLEKMSARQDLDQREKAIFQYFSQKNGPVKDERPGSEECFASLFGLVLTGPENEIDKKPLEKNFPETIEVVRKLIKKL